jgi:imidazolonepropionase-like amidohydrolase
VKRAHFLGALATAGAAFAGAQDAERAPTGGALAVRAGTIHLVEDGQVLTGNAALIVRGGRIVAAGLDLAIPADAHVVDYGPDAVIVPGLVAASSPLALGEPSQRTADAAVRAVDSFDPYTQAYSADLSGGVTTAYLAPARARLIAGQGAVVKLGGSDAEGRVLLDSAALQGSIESDARSVPGYWDIPIPASIDVGLGRAEPQLPGSLMGAIVALRELLAFARGEVDLSKDYGKRTGPQLQELLQRGLPWRLRASSEAEIRALVDLFEAERLPLVVDGAQESGALAAELAAAGAKVVLEVDVAPGRQQRELSRERDARWPRYDVAVRLQEAGVPFAIATPDVLRPRDLLFAAGLASRGGLSEADALRAITLSAAEVLGVAERVGSLAPGKDADFAVLNGAPLAASSSVLATWIGGELAWKAPGSQTALVIEVDELHVGDGEVLAPGQVLIVDGRIAEVSRRVGHPRGAVVVRGRVAMPGMIDATGHLGLEGSSKAAATDFKLARLVGPGDHVDRRVARAGVTTVILAPRGDTKSGTPMMAYKPAGTDLERMVVEDPTALRLVWTDRNRVDSGKDVKELLEKAVEYDRKWTEYERALAAWQAKPQPPAAKPAAKGEEGDKKEGDKEAEKKEGDAAKDEDKKDEKKDDKKKDEEKKDEEKEKKEAEAKLEPYAGIWEADVVVPPWTEAAHLRLRLEPEDGRVVGSLRCDPVSETLVELAGTFADGEVSVSGLGTRGVVSVRGKPKDGELEGELALGAARVELKAKRTSTELPRAARSERRREKKEEVEEPKDKPKPPGRDEKLEPIRRAIHGQGALVIQVDRREEIRDCVAACQRAGIRPILYGADDAWRMASELAGKVAGVLLNQQVLDGPPRGGLEGVENRFAVLEQHGIPVAFQSDAEEGAAELPLQASYAVALGLSPDAALRALCAGVARMFAIEDRVGLLAPGRDGDVLLLDGPPLEPRTSVLRAWVSGEEVR